MTDRAAGLAAVSRKLCSRNCRGVEVDVIGTNAIATANMLKSGVKNAATGENPVVVMAPKADVIIGPVGIAVADSMMGEVTPAMRGCRRSEQR